ncbi:MAG: PH domain-containing protein [Xanthobacteraceae bacterium]
MDSEGRGTLLTRARTKVGMSLYYGSSIERELGSDERLLWKGAPQSGIKLRPNDGYLIPFSLFWGGFAIFWEYGALQALKKNPAALLFPLFGIPFVLMGLYMVFGRFFVDAKMRANTEYAVTSRRAIIVSGLFSRNVRSIDLQSTPEIALNEKADQSGTIYFGPVPYGWGNQRNPWSFGMPSQSAFEMIENVRSVYEIIQQAKSASAQPRRN